jgi:hypothetical protein
MSETIEHTSDLPQEDAGGAQEMTLAEIVRRASEGQTAEEITAAETAAEGPARDEKGRFVSKNADPGDTEIEQDDADQPAPTVEEPETPAIAPPKAWSASDAEHFAKAPREVQEIILRREAEVERGFQERAARLKDLDAIQEALAPFASAYRAQGFTDVDAVRMWATVANELRRAPLPTILELMRQHNISLEQLTGQPAQTNMPPPTSQTDAALQRVERLERLLAQREQEQIAARIAWYENNPKFPHFSAVRVQMGKLMAAGIVPDGDFEGAYEKAIRIVPEVWEKIQAEERAAAEARQRAEAKARAEAARKSPPGPRTSPPVSTGYVVPKGDGSVMSDVINAIAALEAR